MNIYVEIPMRTSMERLWEHTQTPEMHERWDLRFSTIEYLPRPDLTIPQQFLYTTRIGFGLAIRGKGETVGSKVDSAGCRTSALKFWSEEPISLIERGSGYWKYEPTGEGHGVRFLTEYTYQTRFGGAGALFDRWVFRPLMGWATAWSFDRLRLWVESGIDPAVSLERSIVYSLVRLTLAFIWIYQGVFPKLLFRDTGELSILQQSQVLPGYEPLILSLVGVGEILFGLLLVFLWHSRVLLWMTILGLGVLGVGALLSQPQLFVAPFNPLTLNLSMTALAIIGLVVGKNLPSAGRCRRKRAEKDT
ncbi:MAG: DoxX-like family protein [Armatimonadota bacterium]